MASIAGVIKIGEAQPVAKAVVGRTRGPRFVFWLLLFGLIAAGAAAGVGIATLLHGKTFVGLGFGLAIGGMSYVPACTRLSLWLYRSKLEAKGTPLHLPVHIEVTPEAITYEVGDTISRAKWTAVSELFPSHGYWIFLVQGAAYIVPERFFSNVDEKRAAISEALGYMTEAARARSAQAVKFVEKGAL